MGLALTSGSCGAGAAEIPALEFSIKPRLCVLTAAEEACYDELELRWRAAAPMTLCLHQNRVDEPLTCWSESSEGIYRFVLSTSENVTFELRQPGERLLVSEAFQVIHDDNRYRRPRRNPWSFF